MELKCEFVNLNSMQYLRNEDDILILVGNNLLCQFERTKKVQILSSISICVLVFALISATLTHKL